MITQGRSIVLRVLGICLVAGGLLSGCSNQKALQQLEADPQGGGSSGRRDVRSSKYVIQYGDQVQLTVFGYPEFSCSAIVKESGTMTVPLVGELRAVGLTRDQVIDEVVTKLSEYVKSKVIPSITITSAMSQRIVVLGSVGNQGSYILNAPASPFQVLALAGGPSKDADLSRIKVMRNGDPGNSTDMDLTGYIDTDPGRHFGPVADLPAITPGDVVYVPKEENIVRSFADLLRDVVVLFGIFALVR